MLGYRYNTDTATIYYECYPLIVKLAAYSVVLIDYAAALIGATAALVGVVAVAAAVPQSPYVLYSG